MHVQHLHIMQNLLSSNHQEREMDMTKIKQPNKLTAKDLKEICRLIAELTRAPR